jgi:hypothetical protein
MSTAPPMPIALFARAWPFVAVGFLLTLAAASIHQSEAGVVVGSVILTIGLFLVGVGVAIQLQTSVDDGFTAHSRFQKPARFLVTVFQVGVIAIFSWMLLAALIGIDPFGRTPPNPNVPMNIKSGPMLIAWLLVVPLTIHSLRTMWRVPLPGSVETGLVLVVACLSVVIAGRSLPIEADTLRFFLSVLAFAIAFGVSLMTARVAVRYIVLSIVATLHFLGIVTATLATPPSPWLATQVWHRLAHPYLEFMYLNNAYHFYSPEPGATTHFWMYVYYDTGEKMKLPDGKDFPKLDSVLVKIPDVDDQGRSSYPVSLEYQRMLSLNENITSPEVSPPLYQLDTKGQILPGAILKSRLINSTTGDHWRDVIIGQDPALTTPEAEIPLVPGAAPETQYQKPGLTSLRLMESFIRYAGRKKHPTHPEWRPVMVRAYRALHAIPIWPVFMTGADPNDPTTFRVSFNGTFDPKDGTLNNANEVLLNWVIPTLKAQPDHADSPVFCWYRLHALERKFIYLPATKEYVRMTPELRRQFPREWTENLWKYVPPEWVQDWEE